MKKLDYQIPTKINDLYKDIDLSVSRKIVSDIADKIQDEKQNLIEQRIKERVPEGGFSGFELESQRKFPRLRGFSEQGTNAEHWYWNDNSINGIHLITFYTQTSFPALEEPYTMKMNFGFKYE